MSMTNWKYRQNRSTFRNQKKIRSGSCSSILYRQLEKPNRSSTRLWHVQALCSLRPPCHWGCVWWVTGAWSMPGDNRPHLGVINKGFNKGCAYDLARRDKEKVSERAYFFHLAMYSY